MRYHVKRDKNLTRDKVLKSLTTSSSFEEASKMLWTDTTNIPTLLYRLKIAALHHDLEKEYLNLNIRWSEIRGKYVDPSKVFTNPSPISQSSLREYIKRHHILEYKCLWCGIENTYNGKNLKLHIDHIDGNPKNNGVENLRYLCPNCHSQTETYCRGHSKPQGRYKKICPECNVSCIFKAKNVCRDCYNKNQGYFKLRQLSKENLDLLLKNYAMMEICKFFKCSYVNLNKLINETGLIKIPYGHWISVRSKNVADYSLMRSIADNI